MTNLSPYDSLVLAGEIELWGQPGGVPSTNPLCPGAVFQVMPGFSLGTPQPTTDFTGTLVLDGERPFGTRASNRLVTLGVKVTAPTGDWSVLAGARELLLQLTDQQFWTLTWTRRSSPEDAQGFPFVLDCFRAQPSVVQYGGFDQHEIQPVGLTTLTFPALPYGRADVAQQIAFAAPVAAINAPSPPPAPVVLDAFTTINSPQVTQSGVCVVGPRTAFWDPGGFPAGTPDGTAVPLTYSAVLPQVNLTGLTGISMWLGLGSRYRFNLEHSGTSLVTVLMTLTDNDGTVLSFTTRTRLSASADPANPVWSRVTMAIPQGVAAFNYAAVSAYSLTIRNGAPRPACPGGELRWTCAYLDALTAVPASVIPITPSIRGSIYNLQGVQGTARTMAAFTFSQAPAPGTVTTITATGSGNYTVPAATAYCKAEAVGGGGAGASQAATGFGGGGGGAEYACEPLFPCVPAQVIGYSVGAGGTPGAAPANGGPTVFGAGTGAVVANGGMSAGQNSTIGGLGGTGSANTIRFPGGAGRTASGSVGGGGGGSGGSSAPGNVPTGTAAVTLTGSGNWTAPPGVTQVTAFAVAGGGGGGSGSSSLIGSGGGGGESATRTFTVVPGTSYPYAVGGGGAGGTASGHTGSNGSATTFTAGGLTLTANGGQGGQAYAYWNRGPGGSGGTGSTAPVHNPGGTGGAGNPYTGGGGSSAGTAGAGNSGDGYGDPGPAPSGGGQGGAGSGSGNGNGGGGSVPGGGGGGSYNATFTGGAGAAGTLTLTYPGGAPTNNGATAVTGGGAGGAGGPSANTAGTAGSQPGGGGGGADSAGTAEAGGGGGAGKLTITPYIPPGFKTLIAHRPSALCPVELNPLVALGGVPGTTEFPVASLVAGIPARFDGTYSVVLIAQTWNNPSSVRTISVTVKQYEYPGGASSTVTTTPVAVTPSTQVSNGIFIAGTLTLPFKAIPKDNTAAYFVVIVTDSNGSDTFYDCLLLDLQGQTVMINEPSASYLSYMIDVPTPVNAIGNVLGSQGGRPQAVSVSDAAILSGGPLTLQPGRNTFLAYCTEGAPALSVSYFPSYFLDRLW